MRYLILPILIISLTLSCEKEHGKDINFEEEYVIAKIIQYSSEKCFCCPGWTMVVEGDTVKSQTSEIIVPALNGFEITRPTFAKVKFGELERQCPNGIKYYTVRELIKHGRD